MEPGGLWWTSVLNSAFPPQRHRPDTWPEDQDPVSHTAQKKREKERKKKRERGRGIYYEELAHMNMEAEKFYHLLSARWRPMKWWYNSVQVQKPENLRADGINLSQRTREL